MIIQNSKIISEKLKSLLTSKRIVLGLLLFLVVSAHAQIVGGTNPADDYDGDGVINSVDSDDDNDGVNDIAECAVAYAFNDFSALKPAVIDATTGLVVGDRLIKVNALTYLGVQYDAILEIKTKSVGTGTVNISIAGDLVIRDIVPNTNPYVTYTIQFVPTGTVTTSTGAITPSTINNLMIALADIDGNGGGNLYGDVAGYANSNSTTSIVVGANLSNNGFTLGSSGINGPGAAVFNYYRAAVLTTNTSTVPNTTLVGDPLYKISLYHNSYTTGTFAYGVTGGDTDTIGERAQQMFVQSSDACDTDSDGIPNQFDLDSDNDGCSDANEYYNLKTADGSDGGVYGTGTPAVNAGNGRVTAASYTGDYTNAIAVGPVISSTTPADQSVLTGGTATFTTTVVPASVQHQWQVSTNNGSTWINITDTGKYSGTNTLTLTIANVTLAMSGYDYRDLITVSTYVCGPVISRAANLCVLTVPTLASPSPICSGSNAVFTITGTPGDIVTYTGATSGSATIGSGGTVTVTTLGVSPTTTLNLTNVSNGGCSRAIAVTTTITVNNSGTPPNNTTSTATICESSTKTLLATPASGTWSVQAGGGTIASTIYTPANITSDTAVTIRYTIAATGGCAARSSDVTFTVRSNPNAGTNGTLTICSGSTVTAGQLFAQLGGTPAGGGTWSPALAGAGTYTYTVAATAPCTTAATATVVVSAQAQPNAGTNGTLTICSGSTVTAGQLFAQLGGTPAGGGTWSPALAGAGTYTYTVAATAPCTTAATATVVVSAQAQPNAGTNGTLTICSGSTVTAGQLFAQLGGTPAGGGTWSPAVAGAGTYTYTVAATAPCTTAATATVVVSAQAQPNAGTNGTLTICSGSTVTAGQLFAQLGGTPAGGGTWSPALAGAGTYTYTVAATAPCTTAATATVVVSAQAQPNAGTNGTLTICSGSTVTAGQLFAQLGGTPAGGGTWSPALAGAGTYTYTVAATAPCTTAATATVVVSAQAQPNAGTNGTLTICSGSTVTAGQLFAQLGGTPAGGGTWSPALAGAGTYTYTVAATAPCTTAATATVVVSAQAQPNAGTNGTLTICSGSTVTAGQLFAQLGGTPAGGGTWSPALAGAGTYTYTVAATAPCTTAATATVVVSAQAQPNAGTNGTLTICSGSTVTAGQLFAQLGGTPAGGGTWSPALAGAGTYTYTVAATAPCTTAATATVVVSAQAQPNAGTNGTLTICSGSTVTAGQLFAQLGGTPAGGGTWSPALAGAGTYTYTVAATAPCTTAATATVVVSAQAQPNAGTNGTLTICSGSTVTAGQLFAQLGGTPAGGGTWSPVLAGAGTYTYTVAATAPCTTAATATVVVSAQAQPNAGTNGTLTICSGSTVTAGQLFAQLGGTPAGGGTWSPALAGAGTYTYTVAATAPCTTAATATVVVSAQAQPNAGTNGTLTICSGSTVTAGQLFAQLGGTPAGGGTWSPALAGAGTYTYTVAATAPCTTAATATVVVSAQAQPNAGTNGTLTICSGSTVTAGQLFAQLGGTPAGGGTWSPALAGAGTYTYTVAATAPCTTAATATVVVSAQAQPNAGTNGTLTICSGSTVTAGQLFAQLGGTPAGGGTWSPALAGAGTYTYTVAATAPCTTAATATVVVSAQAQPNAGTNGTLTICSGSTVTAGQLFAQLGGTPAGGGTWSPALAGAGTYTYTVAATAPCTTAATATVVVSAQAQPNAGTNGTLTICSGSTVTAGQLFAQLGGTPAGGGTWSPALAGAGTYTYTVAATAPCTTAATATVVVSAQAQPNAGTNGTLTICSGSTVTAGQLFAQLGGTPAGGGTWSPALAGAGTYTYTVAATAPCTTAATATVVVSAQAQPNAGTNGTLTICSGSTVTAGQLFAQLGGTPAGGGTWSPALAGAGTYTYTVAATAPCTTAATATVVVSAQAQPNAGTNGTLTICSGSTVTAGQLFAQLGGTPAGGGTWSPALAGAGTYTYTVAATAPCTTAATATVVVSAQAQPNAGTNGTLTICSGSTVTAGQLFAQLGGTPAGGGTWSPALAGAGTYTYTVAATAPCTTAATATVVVSAQAQPNAGTNGTLTICSGSTVTAGQLFAQLGGTPAGGGTWSPALAGAGTYTYTVAATAPCTTAATATVVVSAQAQPNAGTNGTLTICSGSTVTAGQLFAQLGGTPAGGGTWSPVLAGAGTYTYTVAATAPCTTAATATVVVSAQAQPNAGTNGTLTICSGSTVTAGQLFAQLGGTPAGGGTWSPALAGAGTYTYTVAATAPCTTAATATVVVSAQAQPNAGTNGTLTICSGSTVTAGQLFAQLGGTPAGGGTWSPALAGAGTYTYTVAATAPCTTAATATVVVSAQAQPNAGTNGTLTICSGSTVTAGQLFAQLGGTPAGGGTWSPALAGAGTYTYTVAATAPCTTAATATVVVSAQAQPNAGTNGTLTICSGSTVTAGQLFAQLGGTPAGGGTWSPALAGAGTYTYTVAATAPCTTAATATVVVSAQAQPNAGTNGTLTICSGSTVTAGQLFAQLGGTPAGGGTWSPALAGAGTYTYTVAATAPCTTAATATVVVSAQAQPNAGTNGTLTICSGSTVTAGQLFAQLGGTPAGGGTWSPALAGAGTYTYTVAATAPCTTAATATVVVSAQAQPNAGTNGTLTICSGSTVTAGQLFAQLGGTPAGGGTWSPALAGAGTYTYTVAATAPCTTAATATVVVSAQAQPNAGTNGTLTICSGSTVTAGQLFAQLGGTPAGGGTWSPALAGAGTYTYTVAATAPCTTAATATVVVSAQAQPNAGTNGTLTICSGSTVTAGQLFAQLGGTPAGGGTWSPVLAGAGTYTYTVAATAPCTTAATATVVVSAQAQPNAGTNGTLTICSGSTVTAGQLFAQLGGTPAGGGTWSPALAGAGTYTYTVAATAPCTTAATATVVVSAQAQPNAGTNGTLTICSGSTVTAGQLFAQLGGTPAGGGTWSPALAGAGTYTYTVAATAPCTTAATATVVVSAQAQPNAGTNGTLTICSGSTVTAGQLFAQLGGTPAGGGTWSPALAGAGTYTYTVAATAPCTTAATATVVVSAQAQPNAGTNGTLTICSGSTVTAGQLFAQLGGTPAGGGTWSPALAGAGTYTYTVAATAPCTTAATATVVVSAQAQPNAGTNGTLTICSGSTVTAGQLFAQLGGTPAGGGTWSPALAGAGTYTYTVAATAPCTTAATATVVVSAQAQPNAGTNGTLTICSGSTVTAGQLFAQLGGTPAGGGTWSPALAGAGTYTYTVAATAPCTTAATATVVVSAQAQPNAGTNGTLTICSGSTVTAGQLFAQLGGTPAGGGTWSPALAGAGTYTYTVTATAPCTTAATATVVVSAQAQPNAGTNGTLTICSGSTVTAGQLFAQLGGTPAGGGTWSPVLAGAGTYTYTVAATAPCTTAATATVVVSAQAQPNAGTNGTLTICSGSTVTAGQLFAQLGGTPAGGGTWSPALAGAGTYTYTVAATAPCTTAATATVVVSAQAQPNAGTNGTLTICSGSTVTAGQLFAQLGGTPAGGGTWSPVLAGAGTYTYTVAATAPCTTAATATVVVSAQAQPNAGTNGTLTICSGSTVTAGQLFAQLGGTPAGGGTWSPVLAGAGTYTYTVAATAPCTTAATATVVVSAQAQPNAGTNGTLTICSGSTVTAGQLFAQLGGTPAGGGTWSPALAGAGTYTYTVAATAPCTTAATATVVVSAQAQPNAGTNGTLTICSGSTITAGQLFAQLGGTPAGGGTWSPALAGAGTYTYTVAATAPCTTAATATVVVSAQAQPNAGTNGTLTICSGSTVTAGQLFAQLGGTPAGGGTWSPALAGAGTYTYTVAATAPCTTAATATVVVSAQAQPNAGTNGTLTICSGSTVTAGQLFAQLGGTPAGGGTWSPALAGAGTYTYTVAATAPCTTAATATVVVSAQAQPNAGTNGTLTICSGSTVTAGQLFAQLGGTPAGGGTWSPALAGAGTYTYTVAATAPCTTAATATVVVSAQAQPNAGTNGTLTICSGSTVTAGQLFAQLGGTPAGGGTWSPALAGAGTYTYTVAATAPCTTAATATVVVSAQAQPNAGTNGTLTICSGSTVTAGQLFAQLGGTPAGGGTWSPALAGAGTYTYTVAATAPCTTAATATVVVSAQAQPNAGTNGTLTICSGSTVTAGQLFAQLGGTPAGGGTWSPALAGAGTYTYTVAATAPCTTAATATVVVSAQAQPNAGTNGTLTICSGSTVTAGQLFAQLGGTPAGGGTWSPALAGAGTYTYTVAATAPCTTAATATVVVSAQAQPNAGTNGTLTICSGSTVTAGQLFAQLGGTPAGGGTWSPALAGAGTYTYTVAATAPCTTAATATVVVSAQAQPNAGTNGTLTICSGSTVTAGQLFAQLGGTPAGGGTWSPALAGAGTYTYTVAATAPCTTAATATVVVSAQAQPNAGTNGTLTICSGSTVTAGQLFAQLGGTPAGGGTWSPALAGAGTYTYTVAATAPCTTAATATVVVSAQAQPNAGTNGTLTICSGSTVTAGQLFAQLGGTPAGGGTWSPALAGAGTYTYTVAATAPCTTAATATVVVSAQAQPNAGTNGTLTICSGSTVTAGQLFAQLGGTPAGGGTWSPALAGAGTYTYTVAATAPCTTAATATVVVSAQAQPNAGTNGTLTICSGSTVTAGQLFAQLGGTPAGGGTWSPALAGAGTYTYTVAATAPCTTAATATVVVSAQAQPNAGTNGTLTICSGSTVTAGQLFAQLGGTPAGGGTWSPALAGAGTYTYTVAATAPCTTAATATVVVIETVKPTDIVTTITICSGDNYTWPANGIIYSTTQTGTRINNNGCTADQVLNLTISPLNSIAIGENQNITINNSISDIILTTTGATGATFTGLPTGVTGSWTGNVATITGTPTLSGTFNYTVTTTGGCPPATATGTIIVNNPPVATNDTNATIASSAGATGINALTATDSDGTIASYTVLTLPANGTLALGGVAVTVNQVLTPAEAATLTYDPIGTFTGTDSFTFTATDNSGAVDATPATISIPVGNNAPVANNNTNASIASTAGATAINALTATDSDGTIASYTIVTLPAHGILALSGTPVTVNQILTPAEAATLTYDPSGTFTGTDSFTFTATDNNGLVDASPATISLPVGNNAPVANNDANNTIASTAGATAINALTATDSDGTIASYTIVTLPAHGILALSGTPVTVNQILTPAEAATLTYDPSGTFTGTDSFTFTATDNNGLVDASPATISLPVGNNAPVANNDANNTIASTAGATAINALTAIDSDGTIASYTIVTLPAHGILALSGTPVTVNQILTPAEAATLTYDPSGTFTGTDSFTFTATDNNGLVDASPATINIPVGNNAPVANNDTNATIASTATATAINALTATDSDGTIASYTVVSLPANGILALGGTPVTVNQVLTPAQALALTYDPSGLFTGNDSFTFTATDNSGTSDATPATINIPVGNNAPVANNDTNATIASTATATAINALTATDSDGTIASYTIVSLPANGILALAGTPVTVNQVLTPAQALALTYDPSGLFTGNDSFTFTATDNSGTSDATPATINIPVGNNAPVANNDTNATIASTATATAINALTATDSDGTIASYTIVSLPANGILALAGTPVTVNQVLTPAQALALTYDPSGLFTGNDSFTFTATDNSGTSDATPATINIPVGNNAPVANNDTNATIASTATATAINALTATDSDGTIASYTIVSLPANGILALGGTPVTVNQVLTPAQALALTYDPSGLFTGNDSFTFTATDNSGTSDATPATINIPVGNNAPVANNDTNATIASTATATAINALTATDSDGTIASYTIVSLPANGILALGGTPVTVNQVLTPAQALALTYDPSGLFTGNDSFTFTATDNSGTSDATPATITIPVGNNAPVANNDTNATIASTATATAINALTATDSDGTIASYTVVSLPANGILALGGTPVTVNQVLTPAQALALTYDPSGLFTGNDSFTFTATDNSGTSDATPATITIPVGNNAPVANNDTNATIASTATATAINALTATDSDGTIASYTVLSLPANGILALGGTPVTVNQVLTPAQALALTYDPSGLFTGNDSFTFTATDNSGTSDATPATITIPVGNNAPVANNDTNATIASTATATAINALTATDSDGTIASYTVLSLPANGILALGGTPVTVNQVLTPAQALALTYDPSGLFTGNDSFTFTATDNSGTSDATPATITIPVGNNAPVANNDTNATIASTATATAINALTATDSDGTIASYTVLSLPANGILALGGTPVTVNQVLTPAQALALTYDPSGLFTGNDSFTFTATDNSGTSDATPATITIPVGNNAPVANNDTNATIASIAGATAINALTATDSDGTIASYTVLTLPANGILALSGKPVTVNQILTPAEAATLTYDPSGTFTGTDSFTFTATDNNGLVDSSPSTISLPVGNNAPVANNDANSTIASTATATAINALTATDSDGTIVSYTVLTLPAHGTLALSGTPVTVNQILTPAEAATLTYDPSGTFTGTDSFTFTATDNSGAVDATPATISIPVGITPIEANPDTKPTPIVGINQVITVLNVLDNDKYNGGNATLSQVSIAQTIADPTGYMTLKPDGTIELAPNTPADTYTLTYSLCEIGVTPANCDIAIVTVEVVNPIMNITAQSVCINDVPYVSYTATPVNFTPINGLTITWTNSSNNVITTMTNLPLSGNVLWPGATIDTNGNGTDWPGWVFTNNQWIQTADGFETLVPSATLTFALNPTVTVVVNYPPASPLCKSRPTFVIDAINDSVNSIDGVNGATNVLNVFKNDLLNTIAINPSDVTLALITPDPKGALTLNGNGSIDVKAGTPAGTYQLTYQICENADNGNCDTATATVVVKPIPGISAVNDIAIPIRSSNKVQSLLDVLTNDTFDGLPINPTNVVLTFKPNVNFTITNDGLLSAIANIPEGNYVLTYTICEKSNLNNCSTATITVLVQSRPRIAIVKTAHFNDENGDGYAQDGETVTYRFEVTNTGNVPLINVNIVDPLPGVVISGSALTLGVGEIDSTNFEGKYVIKKSDITSGTISNQATVYGTSPNGVIVEDKSDAFNAIDDNPTILSLNECIVKVFNAVSPDGSGPNGVFFIQGIECYPENTVEIYNRWGVLIFEKENYNNNDKAFKGISEGRVTVDKSQELPVGTYFYILKYRNSNSDNIEKSGYLYLNRR
ncbi:Ig-like domain-containing protein [Flavobacterium sp. WC2509]|uniref:Ig-like domain-containing protein n=1 Tax=Flavobacterium sp. WC2509 TaxID=3461406 RepID=UPI004044C2C3